MDWNAIGAISGVIGAVLTFISIIVAIGLERTRNVSNQSSKYSNIGGRKRDNEGIPIAVAAHDPYAPYLYISVVLIGACGGVASILFPWLLLQESPELQCLLAPLLITGLLGGAILALLMDKCFEMEKSTPYLRFPLSAISGVIGGLVGSIVVIVLIMLAALKLLGTTESTSPSSARQLLKSEERAEMHPRPGASSSPYTGFSVQTCAFCKGKGKHFFDRCPACKGRGIVSVYPPPKKCALCKGKGIGLFEPCSACNGTGWALTGTGEYDANLSVQTCALCKGKGRRLFDKCPACKGRGVVLVR